MTGTIEHLSISKGGLPKLNIPEAWTGALGLEGDRHNHPTIHGGPRKAVLLISAEDLEALLAEGFDVSPGSLGENLTVRGLDFRQLRAGQRFLAGGAVLELTQLRQPCQQLERFNEGREGRIQEALKAVHARGGFYAAVVQDGLIRTGDRITMADQSA
jgi:MOSC domain-containing protein YiiM